MSYVNLTQYVQMKENGLYVCHVYIYFYNYEWRTDKEIIIVTEPAFVGQTIIFFLYKKSLPVCIPFTFKGNQS